MSVISPVSNSYKVIDDYQTLNNVFENDELIKEVFSNSSYLIGDYFKGNQYSTKEEFEDDIEFYIEELINSIADSEPLLPTPNASKVANVAARLFNLMVSVSNQT